MRQGVTRSRSKRLRFALLAHASTVALIATGILDHVALAKSNNENNNGQGGIGRNPNDLKDGVIDGNAGGQHQTSQQTNCALANTYLQVFNITNATPMPITGKILCAAVNSTISHDVVTEATIGDPGTNFSPFLVGKTGVITGTLWNKGIVIGGYPNLTGSGLGALTIVGDVQNGVHNSGLISSPGNNGLQLGLSNAGIFESGTIEGGITNDGIITAYNDGISMIAGALSGGLTNNDGARITGSNAGVYIADTFESWSGGIENAGSIHGGNVGILIGEPGSTNVEFSGGILNEATGVINSEHGPAIFASGASFSGGLTNWGLITETGHTFADVYGGSGVVLDAQTVTGDVENHGTIDGIYRQGVLVTGNVAEFDGSIVNAGMIDGAQGGVAILAQNVHGNFSNTGNITGGANTGVAYFNSIIEGSGGEGSIATFTNTGSIIGNAGFVVEANTVHADFTNGDSNTGVGSITGNTSAGVVLVAQSWSGTITNNGSISGATVGMAVGYDPFWGTATSGNTLDGSIVNNGSIHGGTAGVVVAVDNYNGSFTNNGSITGGHYGVALEGADNFAGTALSVNCEACITPLSLGGGIFTGDVTNNGFMSGDTALFVSHDRFTGNVTNTGILQGANYGLLLDVDDFQGNFNNSGTITAGAEEVLGIAVQIGTGSTEGGTVSGSQSFAGDLINSGLIHGQNTGLAVALDSYTAGTSGLTNSGTIIGDNWSGIYVRANQWSGDITNESGAKIVGGATGIYVSAGTFKGDVSNTGYIEGGATGVFMNAGSISGNFSNDGSIVGGDLGVALRGGNFTGDAVNHGFVSGAAAFSISNDDFTGNVTNTGALQGSNYGLLLDVDAFHGNLNNSGTITAAGDEARSVAVQIGTGSIEGDTVSGSQNFAGDIGNSDLIHGQNTGLAVVLDSYTAGPNGLTNSGTIIGDNWSGVYIRANQWSGDITNASGGKIVGGATGIYVNAVAFNGNIANAGYIEGGVTGVFVNAGTINGDFSNTGTIVGHSADTGWNVTASAYTGNIDNDGLLTAPSNALHLRIDSFAGAISNEGVISAPSGNAVAIEGNSTNGTYAGGFTNSGTINGAGIGIDLDGAKLTGGITNAGGTIDAATAISTNNATGATTITNTGGGIIIGDLRFSNNYADTFVAEDGGITGNIIGSPGPGGNDDAVVVQNGTQYFIGKASNLASFTVGNGGVAILGATSEGAASGTGFSFSNVGAINVQNGGSLYIDRSTTLTAGSYSQQSGGSVEYYLGAPGGANFSNLTGTQDAVVGTDYGQIHVSGTATLGGNIAAFLDPAFTSANLGLDSVVYHDVLVADGGITGNFSTEALISNSNLFELHEAVVGNGVDLTVSRTSLGQLGNIGGIVVETGGPWKAMVNDRSNGIGSGSCTIAGSGWCLNAFAANDAGGTSVMSDATPGADAFDWLRTGVRQVGDTAVWARGVGVWGDTTGDANHAATDFNSYGAIAGIDHVFTSLFMAGLAAQWTKSNVDFAGSPDSAHVDSFEVGGYMSYGDARFYVNANSSVIFHSIDVTRFAPGGSAHGDYDGVTVSGYAEAGRIFETYEGWRIQPLAALSYAHLDTDAYDETGTATTLLHVFDASLDSLRSMIGARVAYPVANGSDGKIVPEARLLWAHEFMDDHASFDANPQSNPLNVATITGQTYSRDSLVLGTGVTAPLSSATTLFLDYDATLNPDMTTHTVSGGLRARW